MAFNWDNDGLDLGVDYTDIPIQYIALQLGMERDNAYAPCLVRVLPNFCTIQYVTADISSFLLHLGRREKNTPSLHCVCCRVHFS